MAIVSRLSLYERLSVLLEKVTGRLQVDAAAVALINPDTRELTYAARRGLDGEFFVDGLLKVKEGIAGQVAHSGEIAAIPDVRAEPRFVRAAIAERLGIASYLAVPLRARGEIIGVLELATRERHTFLPEEVDFFVTLAGQAAIAIDNARMFEEAARRAAQGHALAECAGVILATLTLDALWPPVLDATRQVLSADRAAVYLYDAAADRVACPYASGLSAEYVAEINRRFREVPGGRLLEDPQPVIVADAQTDPLAAPVRDLAAREGFRSYAVFPLAAPGAPLGALVAYRDALAPFTPDDITTGQTLAHIAAVAMQNARLFEAERAAHERAETLREVAHAVGGSLALDEVLNRILEQLKRVITYDTASVLLLGKAGQPELVVGLGHADEKTTSRAAGDLLGSSPILRQMALDLQPVIIADVRQRPGWIWIPGAEHVRSFLCAPIVSRGRMIGALMMDNIHPGFFTETDARLAQSLAQHMAVAIENARLFEETREHANELEFLNRAVFAMTATPNLDLALDQVVALMNEELGYSHASIALVDKDGEEIRLRAQRGIRADQWGPGGRGLRAGQGLVGWVIQHGEPLLVNDVSRDPRYEAGVPETRSELVVPLRSGERTIGVINVESPQLDAYDPEDLRLLSTLAGQLATAIEKARLFEAEQTRRAELSALYDLSRSLADAAYDVEAILNLIARRAVETIHVTFARIALVEAGECVLRAAYPVRVLDHDLGVGRREAIQTLPACYRAAQQNAPVVLRDDDPALSGPEREALFLGLARTLCLVPLRVGDHTLGLLMLGEARREEREPFTPEKIRLARSIGDQAASALHRAQLFAELEQAYLQTVLALANAVDAKDTYTADHAQKLAAMALAVGRELGLNPRELEELRYGAILHDIGKIGIPDLILQKPSKLEPEEWTIMRQHPEIGARILLPVPRLAGAARIVRHHHERYDGKGYPDGLSGEAIPLGARILTVVDSYSAILDARIYKPPRPRSEAIAELKKHAGAQFDPRIVKIFLKILDRVSER